MGEADTGRIYRSRRRNSSFVDGSRILDGFLLGRGSRRISFFRRLLLCFGMCRGADLGQGVADPEDEGAGRGEGQRRRVGFHLLSEGAELLQRLVAVLKALQLDQARQVPRLRRNDAQEGRNVLLGVEPPRDPRRHSLNLLKLLLESGHLLEGGLLLPKRVYVEGHDE